METLQEVLDSFDDPCKKGFYYFEITEDINKLPAAERETFQAKAECLAMSFQEKENKKGEPFFKPSSIAIRYSNGEDIVITNTTKIDKEIIQYWEKRSEKTKNPYMRMRYRGLLFEHRKNDYLNDAIAFMDSIHASVEGEYFPYENETYIYLEQALQIAVKMKRDDLFEKILDLLWKYDQKKFDDDMSCLQAYHFNIMLKYIDRYSKYEALLVEKHEKRFDRLENYLLSDMSNTKYDYVHLLISQTELLCKYYHIKNDRQKIEALIDREYAIIKNHLNKDGLRKNMLLEDVQKIYRKYHMYDKADKVYVDIQNNGEAVLSSMQCIKVSCKIDKEAVNEFLEQFLTGSASTILKRYIVSNIPKLERERALFKEDRKKNPFNYIISTYHFDEMGSPINKIDPENDSEKQFVKFVCDRWNLKAILMRMEVEKMIEQDIMSTESVLAAFKDSKIISEGQKEIFKKGIEAYFANDYITACHILVPQFEAAIRNLVYMNSGNILHADQNSKDGNRYISLDGLLDSDTIKSIMGEDIQNYFKVLFTDSNGWNLRNLTCHGLLNAKGFNSMIADRIVHAFLVLSGVKPIEDASKE